MSVQVQRTYRRRHRLFSDFLGGLGEFSQSTANGGSVSLASNGSGVGFKKVVGCANLLKGTANATGRSAVTSNLSILQLGQYVCDFESRFLLPSASAAGDEFDIYIGFIDSVTGMSTDGALLRIVGAGNLEFVCVNNNNIAGSVITTPITVSSILGSLMRLKINVSEGALPVATFSLYQASSVPGGTSESLLINQQISTNVPTGTVRQTGAGAAIVGRIGTVSHGLEVDYIDVQADFK